MYNIIISSTLAHVYIAISLIYMSVSLVHVCNIMPSTPSPVYHYFTCLYSRVSLFLTIGVISLYQLINEYSVLVSLFYTVSIYLYLLLNVYYFFYSYSFVLYPAT
jgi:hypothetical protein